MIEINVRGTEYLVIKAVSTADLVEAKEVDDAAFGAHHGISMEELEKILEFGTLILLRLKENKVLIGQSQILFQSIEELPFDFSHPVGYCYGTCLLPEFQGRGLGKTLAHFQELAARERRTEELRMTIRVENYASLKLRIGMGYEVYSYDPYFYGADPLKDSRLLLRKFLNRTAPENLDLVSESLVSIDFESGHDAAAHIAIQGMLASGKLGVGISRQGIIFR